MPHPYEKAFKEETRELSIRRVRLTSVLSVFLFSIFGILDYFVYPDKIYILWSLRLLNAIIGSTALILSYKNLGKNHPNILGAIDYLSLGFAISTMVFITGGHESIYYTGLIVIIIGVCYIMPWSLKESAPLCTAIYLSYFLPIILFDKIASPRLFINSNFFLLCTIFIILIATYYGNKFRFKEFMLRYDLAEAKNNLEEAYGKLKELDNLKTQFFSNISHELRTPLTLILAPTESILKEEGGNLTAHGYDLIKIIHGNALRLLNLINDLLDLSKVDAGKMKLNYEKLDLNTFIRGIVTEVLPLAEKKNLSLAFIEDRDIPQFYFDPDKIEKVMLNLIYNAMKFTDEKGKITITSHIDNGDAAVKIRDTGIGMEKKDLKKIFDRFVQLDDSNRRRYEGTGIGLPLAKEFVELHKGIIKVDSEIGVGTIVTFTLPLVPEYTGGEAIEPSKKADDWTKTKFREAAYSEMSTIQSSEKRAVDLIEETPAFMKKIMVVEDNIDMLNFIAIQLKNEYRIFRAFNGQEGWEIAQNEIPDLVITDIMMPIMNGYELCQKIKSNDRTKHIPVILLTAKASLDMKLEGYEKGADEYLTKPFNSQELKTRVKSLLNLRKLEREIHERNEELEKTLKQLKETQSQLVHSEKMASLGQLVAGVAHEMNNPINAAIMGINALEKYIDKKKKHIIDESVELEVKDTTSIVRNSLWNAAEIVSDLRDFSKKDTTGFRSEDIHKGLDSTLHLLHHRIENYITIHKIYDSEVGKIECSLGQLNQVFLNVLQNAIDAIKNKGDIWITTSKAEDKIKISIKDNGAGIKEDDLKHIFDPFFTTKDVGEGVGLGMSISYRLIQNHNGTIEVKSKYGEGTAVVITIPLEHKGGGM